MGIGPEYRQPRVTDFDSQWKSAVRYRLVSRELRELVYAVYTDLHSGAPELPMHLEALLAFLASERGRTDANCCAVDRFFSQCPTAWSDLPPSLREIFDGMTATLHDAIYAPKIAESFGTLPEQLLERVRAIIICDGRLSRGHGPSPSR